MKRWWWALLLLLCLGAPGRSGPPRLRVGVLFSQSGPMAASERGLIEATMLAIDEVNARGGVYLGGERRLLLEPVLLDGASDPGQFARQAQRLMTRERVRLVFGCWTSDARKAVVRAIQPHGGLLFYPVQFEGQELSRSVVYSGPSANQQLFPALDFLLSNHGPRIFLVGSDYVYPRTSNVLARRYVASRGGQIVGERYCPRGAQDFRSILSEIGKSRCHAILSTLNGEGQNAFFTQYREAGFTPTNQPVMSLSLGEAESLNMRELTLGHYSAWGYFMALDNPANHRFLKTFRRRYGADRLLDDPSQTAYWQVYALAEAVERAGGVEPALVRRGLSALVLDTPGGLIRYDPRNLYCWRAIRVGQVRDEGPMRVVWSTEEPLRPEPFPGTLRKKP